MKFGLQYNGYLLPRWADHYIDYNGLRLQLRLASLEGKDISGLVHEYCDAIQHCESFFRARCESIAQQALDLRSESISGHQASNGPSSANASWPTNADGKHLSLFGQQKQPRRTDFLSLTWFGRVNAVAMTRLLSKLAASGLASSDLMQTAKRLCDGACGAMEAVDETVQEKKDLATEAVPHLHNGVTRTDEPASLSNKGGCCQVDDEGLTPLDHAILSADADLFPCQLAALVDGRMSNGTGLALPVLLGKLLLMAVRTGDRGFVQLILANRPDPTVESRRGENCLCCAAESGDLDMVQRIATYMMDSGVDLNLAVSRTGWTALMIASAKGHTQVVFFLLKAGADAGKSDILGWTAQEHAAYRGHLGIAAALEDFSSSSSMTEGSCGGPAQTVEAGPKSTRRYQKLQSGQKALVVTLGSVQGGHDRKTLMLLPRRPIPDRIGADADEPSLCDMSLEIAVASDVDGLSKTVKLPLLEEHAVEPLVGLLDVDAPLQITVKLWKHHSGHILRKPSTATTTKTIKAAKTLVSAGVAILDRNQDYARFGASRESMLREVAVVMLDRQTMDYAGTVLLSYLVAMPFEGLDGSDIANYRRQAHDTARLVGHRGLGQNTAGISNLQIGENTMTSFLSAHRLGAPFVEFDVQLTRDLEAVIFHDFSFSGSGSDVPIHDISLAQYRYASELQKPSGVLMLAAGGPRPRASSSGEDSMLKALQAQERLRHTVDFGGKGFKANTRGHSIQDAFATLEELLIDLPEEIGFDIEMKYQRLHEAVDAGVASVTIDINTFVDAALDKVQRLGGKRPIIFSSFTPEVCILLKLKQSAYPVMFITNAGQVPMADRELRAASLQMGVHFARRWHLEGLVVACDTFLLCPRLIGLVRNAGLVCASYGVYNNDAANARKQVDAGIDILIVDKVRLIAEELARGLEG